MTGESGAGKSRLLIALGTAATLAGFRVRCSSLASKLAGELAEAAADKQLTKAIARYGRVELLCVDELGSTEPACGAVLLFQVLTGREEKTRVRSARRPGQDPHRPAAACRHRGQAHFQRHHHRDRHPVLPPGPHQPLHIG